MTLLEAIRERRSIRRYQRRDIPEDILQCLRDTADACNSESGLSIQIITNEPTAFDTRLAHYGKFDGVENYIAIVGKKKAKNLHETAGYYGEGLVLLCQQLGLRTCWVALTYRKNKKAVKIGRDERLVCVISFGYGAEDGHVHRNKSFESVTKFEGECPEWFRNGIEAALLAPTAINQQQFRFTLLPETDRKSGKPLIKATARIGYYSHIDLGIVKLHFEIGAGRNNFCWKE